MGKGQAADQTPASRWSRPLVRHESREGDDRGTQATSHGPASG